MAEAARLADPSVRTMNSQGKPRANTDPPNGESAGWSGYKREAFWVQAAAATGLQHSWRAALEPKRMTNICVQIECKPGMNRELEGVFAELCAHAKAIPGMLVCVSSCRLRAQRQARPSLLA